MAWQAKGYSGSGNVEGLIDSLQSRTAIVAGNAKGVFEEVQSVGIEEVVVFAVNDCGMYLPHMDHLVSLHTPKLIFWAMLRRDGSSKSVGNIDFKTHGAYVGNGPDYIWEGLSPLMALSGYFAMQLAYLMGCERIILCGCPGDLTPRFWETGPRTDNFDYQTDGVIQQLTQEMARLPEFKSKVRSMSGFTKEFFGGV
jgi:hypothetical protein